MAIRDIKVQTHHVVYGEYSFDVRGISPDDIRTVLIMNRESLEMLSDLAEAQGINGIEAITTERLLAVAEQALAEIPDLAAALIAQCEDGGSISNYLHVKRLPITVQMDALMKIASLTFNDATNFGVFLGNVMAAVKGLKKHLPTPPINDPERHAGTVN